MWRRAREIRLLRPALAVVDRLWWARVIRRADVVDTEFVRAQGAWRNSRLAVRAYVRGGYRKGMSLNPLFLEKLVSSQLSDAGRVPALYAYLVSDARAVRTSTGWDAPAYAARHPESVDAAGGPLGHAWRAANATGALLVGSDERALVRPWADVHAATREAARIAVGQARPPDLPILLEPTVLLVRVSSDEWDAAGALDAAATLSRDLSATIVVAVAGRSADLWSAATLMKFWLLNPYCVIDDDRILNRVASRCRPESILVVRGLGAEISASDLAYLAHSATERPAAPLWLSEDGSIASAGIMTDRGVAFHLLAGHPREDADALGERISVSAVAGGTFARRVVTDGPDAPATTLLRATVRSSVSDEPRLRRQGPDMDVEDLLRPTSLRVAGWTSSGPRLRRERRVVELPDGEFPSLRWAIKTAAPPGPPGEAWGDTHFARGIADALRRRGQEVVIDAYAARGRPTRDLDDVVLALRGPEPIDPHPESISMLWIISHPDQLTAQEASGFDAVFAASNSWSDKASALWGRPVEPLLQCTDTRRFHPTGLPRTDEIVFVGTARAIERPSVLGPIQAGIPVSVYGPDWRGWIPASAIKARGVPNASLPAMYESAGVVLNDHWPAMKSAGFVSNRLFDVIAAGGRAISDDVSGIPQIFEGAVATYQTVPELVEMLSGDLDELFPSSRELARISHAVRSEHSFDRRAIQLLDTALEVAALR